MADPSLLQTGLECYLVVLVKVLRKLESITSKAYLSRATEFYNEITGSSYSYDVIKRELVSYDTVVVAKQKAL